MISFRYNADALVELSTRLNSLPGMAKAVARQSARRQANAILQDAQDNYVPEDQGDLRTDSGVDDLSAGSEVRMVIWFGRDKAKAYAIAIHEHLSASSPPSWKKAEAGTQGRDKKGRFTKHGVHFKKGGPKYLELPAMKAADKFVDTIGEDVKNALSLPESWKSFADVTAE